MKNLLMILAENMIGGLVFSYFILIFSSFEFQLKRYLALFVSISSLFFITTLLITNVNIPYILLIKVSINTFIPILLIYFIFKLKLIKAIILSFVFMFLNFISEISILLIISKSFTHLTLPPAPGSLEYIFIVLIYYIFFVFLLTMCKNIIHKTKDDKHVDLFNKRNMNLKLVLFLSFSLFLLIYNFLLFLDNILILPPTIFITYIISYLLIVFLLLTVIYNINKLNSNKLETINLTSKLSAIEFFSDELRIFKHNYMNYIQMINNYIDQDNIKELHSYIEEITSKTNTLKSNQFFSLEKIKNITVAGILSDKIALALKNNVTLDIFLDALEINEINLNTLKLTEALGILIDNAIESSSLSNDRKVLITITDTNTETVFAIKNSYSLKPDLSKIFRKNYSTKSNTSGLGLYYLDTVLQKNKNVKLNTLIENDEFIQELCINK